LPGFEVVPLHQVFNRVLLHLSRRSNCLPLTIHLIERGCDRYDRVSGIIEILKLLKETNLRN